VGEGEAEVHEDRRPASGPAGDDHVPGLEVPVQESVGVQGAETAGARDECRM
jgi:hypothetical protein